MRHSAIWVSAVCTLCIGASVFAAEDTVPPPPPGNPVNSGQIIWDTKPVASPPPAPITVPPTGQSDAGQSSQVMSDNPPPNGQAGDAHIIWDTNPGTSPPTALIPPPPAGQPNAGQSGGQVISGNPSAGGQSNDAHIIWNNPGEPAAATRPRPPAATAANTQSMCREFERTIVIDGREQPAHGTVCRQPDGRWRIVN